MGYIAEVLCLVQPSIQKINLRAGSGGDDGTVKKAVVQDPELLSRLDTAAFYFEAWCWDKNSDGSSGGGQRGSFGSEGGF